MRDRATIYNDATVKKGKGYQLVVQLRSAG